MLGTPCSLKVKSLNDGNDNDGDDGDNEEDDCRPSISSSSHMSFIAILWWPINSRVAYLFLSHLGDFG